MVADRLAIDSNAFIAYRVGDAAVRQWIEQARLLFMPITVMGELLYGQCLSGILPKGRLIRGIILE